MDMSMFEKNKVIPLVVVEKSIEFTLAKLRALFAGGIKIAEVAFRNADAEEMIRVAKTAFAGTDMIIGAGTVITASQCRDAIGAGAEFVVSPGFSKEVAQVCKQNNVPYVPGVVTPTEIIDAKAEGFDLLKFFPAESYGGVKTLKALAAAFPDVRFVPTGGIDFENMKEYLSEPFVRAVGCSWIVKGDEKTVTEKARATAVAIEEL